MASLADGHGRSLHGRRRAVVDDYCRPIFCDFFFTVSRLLVAMVTAPFAWVT